MCSGDPRVSLPRKVSPVFFFHSFLSFHLCIEKDVVKVQFTLVLVLSSFVWVRGGSVARNGEE